ncbi:DUF1592 domain-containing protein [bacterium]|nr:DUF1592 domain-containing protein [bacterium]
MKNNVFCALILVLTMPAPAAESSPADVALFLRNYCTDCHGSEAQNADRRFDHLASDLVNGKTVDHVPQAEMLQEVLDQLNLAAMPPDEAKQPKQEKVKQIVASLTKMMFDAENALRGNAGKVILRRLNRNEYRNTIRDLFHLPMVDFDPTTTFPADDVTDGFDNVGEGLVTSDYLLRNYLGAARQIADKVIRPGPRPEMIHYKSDAGIGTKQPALTLNGARIESSKTDKEARKDAGRMFIKFRQPLGIRQLDKRKGVPADGEYVIRFSAQAVRRVSRYKDEDLRYNSSEPMRLSVSIDSQELGGTAHRIIAEYVIPDDEVIEIEHRFWLEKGFTFHVHWANGPNGSFKRILRKVLPKYNKDALYPIRNPPEMYLGSGPELHVQGIEIEGPFYDSWPQPGFAKFFPSPPNNPNSEYLDASLLRLANAAYRRPVSVQEASPYLELARQHFNEQGDFWAAAKLGTRAILTSPNFLYLAEIQSASMPTKRVSDHELATRLSYFLWSSMPDRELRSLADRGALKNQSVLRQQVERMLSDERTSAFVENFVGQWLGLRKLGEMPPDPETNRAYYEDNLENAMRQETHLFFRHILQENRSLSEFIDSDYTFLNPALARHYGIPAATEDTFRKVKLLPESHRGGLLGQASILTATSNGVESQPVVRGVWVLENLLGTPPSPPPPDIDPLEPDTRGVSTIRQMMEKHRNNPTCYECHRKIDPLGLAMENYDHTGLWRDRYAKHLPIDASAALSDGTTIKGPEGIKNFLKQHPEKFNKCLTEKLLVYALGRRLSFTDRDDIDRITDTINQQNLGLRDLVHQVVTSEAFQAK